MAYPYIRPGDELSRKKGLFTHYGIAFDDCDVLEIVSDSTPRLVSLEEFADGQQIGIRHPPEEERPAILERAMHVLLNPKEYRLLTNNCEHMKNLVLTGSAHSESVRLLAVLTLASIAIYAATRRG